MSTGPKKAERDTHDGYSDTAEHDQVGLNVVTWEIVTSEDADTFVISKSRRNRCSKTRLGADLVDTDNIG